MYESVLSQLCRGEARLIRDTAESWKRAHEEAMLSRDVEEMVLRSLDVPDRLRKLARSVSARAFEENQDIQAVGEALKGIFELSVQALETVADCIQVAESKGFAVENSGKFASAIESARSLKRKFENEWPWIDLRMVEESRQDFALGHFKSARKFLDELRDRNPRAD